MSGVIVIGGGLAGLAAAAALGEAGFDIDLFEARGFLGGRASSYQLPEGGPAIDNCQHVLLGCFVNLLDFYARLGVRDRIRFHDEFYFIEPGGRVSVLRAGGARGPLALAGAFVRLHFLSLADKLAIARGVTAIRREREARDDLDRITMLDWLREKRQTPRAIERFWRQVLVSAVNEDLDRMAARHGFQVLSLGFLGDKESGRMGLSSVPLAELYEAAGRLPRVRVHLRAPVERLLVENRWVRAAVAEGSSQKADYFVCALPFERVPALVPELGLDVSAFEHSPIAGIHLWFDRTVMDLPYAALLDRTVQWAFNKGDGRYVQVVVSAARSLAEMLRQEVVDLAVRELAEFFPRAGEAKLEKSHVVKELRATFSARPGMEAFRPPARTAVSNLFLAGDWTRTGWPATMEGAVRSGYLAAEALTKAAGKAQQFLREA
ncbi:MAG: hydroxysqualene dehydroxylase HpnE [Bryobacteraceae bacterium]|jgi:zeta-carotene desaturase